MLKRLNSITKDKEFRRIYRQSRKIVTPFFILRYCENNKEYSRFGVVVSNKVSKKAVIRNHLKRRIIEKIRQLLPKISPGYDCVLVCLVNINNKSSQQIREATENLLIKLS